MEFPVKTGAPASQRTECAILPVFDDGQLRGATKEVDTAARGLIKQFVRAGDVTGRLGSSTLIHRTQGTAAARWLLVGCGKHADFSAKRLRGRARRRGQRAARHRHEGSDQLPRLLRRRTGRNSSRQIG